MTLDGAAVRGGMVWAFHARITAPGGADLGTVGLRPDWGPPRAWCHWQGIRDGRCLRHADAGPAVIEPVWDGDDGAPCVERIRIGLVDADGEVFACELPAASLRADVERAAAGLVERGVLAPGSAFGFRLYAFPRTGAEDDGSADTGTVGGGGDGLEGEAVAMRPPLHPASLARAVAASERWNTEHWDEEDVPVFIPGQVVDELQAMACEDAEVESGAILIGRLCVDSDAEGPRPALFVRVEAQIPAEHTIARRASLTFTGETWAAVEGVLRLRRRTELVAGWAHTHPFFCRRCTADDRRRCVLARPHFSAADVNVHRTVFPQAWQVAVLLSFLGEPRPRVDLFAWREGRIAPRGFFVCR